MPWTRSFAAAALLAFALPPAAFAQAQGAPAQPYAGLDTRPVKALSDGQVADLRAGRGMGLALAAELNGYPGPMHVLEHAGALNLSPAQSERTKALFEAMRAEAIPLGEELIRREAELDGLFASKAITPARLAEGTAAIGAAQGALRAAHLRYHLATADLLTPEQVARYGQLRGYGGGHAPQGRHGHGSAHGR